MICFGVVGITLQSQTKDIPVMVVPSISQGINIRYRLLEHYADSDKYETKAGSFIFFELSATRVCRMCFILGPSQHLKRIILKFVMRV